MYVYYLVLYWLNLVAPDMVVSGILITSLTECQCLLKCNVISFVNGGSQDHHHTKTYGNSMCYLLFL